MSALDNVKLLEAKIATALDYINELGDKNNKLDAENKQLKEKIGYFQNQINELEFLILGFKEDQQHIDSGILSAIDKLDRVEKPVEDTNTASNPPVQENPAQPDPNNGEMFHDQGYHGNGVYYTS